MEGRPVLGIKVVRGMIYFLYIFKDQYGKKEKYLPIKVEYHSGTKIHSKNDEIVDIDDV